tara:strand:- start:1082 stop:2434 length:1353 start_codon:yes stop_codon:yes gene_type:complete
MSGRVRAKKKSDAQRKEKSRILNIQKEQERLLKESGLDNKTKVINSSQSLSNSQQRYKQKNAEETGLSYGVLTPAQLKAKYGEADDSGDAMDGGGSLPDKQEQDQSKKYNTGSLLQNQQAPIRARGGVLRYPLEAMTDSTDYLQIDIVEYSAIGEQNKARSGVDTLVSLPGNRRNSINRTRLPKGVSNKSLVNKGTVLLQIPANIQDGNSVNTGDSKMNSIVGAALGASTSLMTDVGTALGTKAPEGSNRLAEAGKAATNVIQGALGDSGANTENIRSLITKKLAASAVNALGGNVTMNQLLARQDGTIFNPNMELLFNGPTLRNFRFSFKMTPRGKKEAEQIKLIMRTFKMNMAPKVTSGGPNLFLKTPSVFELRYKSGRRDHPFLHKFKQCFLTDISINYTGEGVYATYENKEPISMIMDLTFKELEPIYDIDYFDKYGFDADNTVGY